jgi:hypothetical protein
MAEIGNSVMVMRWVTRGGVEMVIGGWGGVGCDWLDGEGFGVMWILEVNLPC